jgi:hypothetical protein
MRVSRISAGAKVQVTDAFGVKSDLRATTGVVMGMDFEVVWVCDEKEWMAATAAGREVVAVPWPAEDVSLAEEARSGA